MLSFAGIAKTIKRPTFWDSSVASQPDWCLAFATAFADIFATAFAHAFTWAWS